MKNYPTVNIRRDGLLMRIFPLDKQLTRRLKKVLKYRKAVYLATEAERRKHNNERMVFTTVRCYKIIDGNKSKQLVTNSGYLNKILVVLKQLGRKANIKDLRPIGRKGAFVVDKQVINDTGFRPKQKELLLRMVNAERGQVCYPTGAGKSFLARVYCQALPKARLVFTTKHQAVLKEAYAGLKKVLPNVGIYCSEKKENVGARVMCCSTGSLHHAADWKPDALLVDETQELATPKMLKALSMFKFCRFIGLSANYKDRMDGADFELEGLFGPRIATLSYESAMKVGLIVPIEVRWRSVNIKSPVAPNAPRIIKQKYGIWRNKARNSLIAQDANSFPEDQLLIVVNTVDHAVHLKQLLPDFEICYSAISSKKLQEFKQLRLLPQNYRPLTSQQRDRMKKQFEAGTLKKVIATSVWNRGVNFHKLQVLIRADAGGSKVNDTQIPGRLSRLGKSKGILIDYCDEFDNGFCTNALGRRRQYARKKWKQKLPTDVQLNAEPERSRLKLRLKKKLKLKQKFKVRH
jgi:superfamily II DNA or RNA helicase